MVYDSVYEANNYLRGTARKQHFWENFSGSKLPTYSAPATTSNISWDSSTDVNVSISGNTVTATGGTAWDKFAQSTQTFTPSDSPTLEYTSNASYYNMTGFGKGASSQNGNYYGSLSFGIYSMSGSIAIYENATQVHVGGSHSSTDVLKVTMDSNGLVKYYSGSTLIYTSAQTASGSYDVRFAGYHANASVTATATASSSLGDRWTTNDITGTNTFAMKDAVDGGFQITTGGNNGDHGTITFNDIRQYAPTASELISVVKFDETTIDGAVGFSNDNSLGSSHSAFWSESTETNFKLSTRGTGARTETDTGVVRDTAKHIIGISCGSPNVNMSMDGVLKSTVSSSIPNAPMQPIFYLKTQSATSKTAHITYMECYNT
jgi:hypothetical protein